MKRLLALLLLLGLGLTLGGCWNRRELETTAITLALAFDWDEERQLYLLTAQVAKPSAPTGEGGGGGGGGPSFHVYRAEGRTVMDAVRNITKQSSRRLWYGHIQVLLVGEAAARRGLAEPLDFTSRDGETRLLYWAFVTRGRAGELLQRPVGGERIPALALNQLAKNRIATSKAESSRLVDLYRMLMSPSGALMGLVELVPGQGSSGNEFRLEGSGVIRGDHLVGFLDGRESRGVLWARSGVRSGILLVPCPGVEDRSLGIEIIRARGEVRPVLGSDGKLEIQVRVESRGNLGDQDCRVSLDSKKLIRQVEDSFARGIKEEIMAAVERCKELETDCLGFAVHVEKRYPRYMEQVQEHWHETFMQSRVTVDVSAKIRQLGGALRPVQPR